MDAGREIKAECIPECVDVEGVGHQIHSVVGISTENKGLVQIPKVGDLDSDIDDVWVHRTVVDLDDRNFDMADKGVPGE